MESKPGFRFQPTDKELIKYYLKNKIVGNTGLVDDTINEINLFNHHPASFSSLSRIKSNDRTYYFFAKKQYKTATKSLRKRSTKSGCWKCTGRVINIVDKKSGTKIGERDYFVFEDRDAPKAKGKKSRWAMHEYRITYLPHHDQDSYVICKIFDKGKEANISYGNNSSEPSESLVSDSNTVREISIIPPPVAEQPNDVFSVSDLMNQLNESPVLFPCDESDPNKNNNPNVQPNTSSLAQNDVEGVPPVYRGTAPHLLSDQEFIMQDKSNDYMLKNTVTATNTLHEFEQPGQDYVNGLFVDDLRVHPVNDQENLFPRNAFNPDTLFCDNHHHNVQLQNGDDYWSGLNLEDLFSDQKEFTLRENRNKHRPKKALSVIIRDYSSDSDIDDESTSVKSRKVTSSPKDSVGSSNQPFLQTCEDESLSLRKDSVEPSISRKTRESQLSKQEVKQGMVKTEKKRLVITEEVNPPYIYLINRIIGFILLLALIVIGNTISVYY